MILKGIKASEGIVIKKVFKLEEVQFEIPKHTIDNIENELISLDETIEKSLKELEVITKNTNDKLGPEHAMIFEAHQQMLLDPEMIKQVKELISNGQNAANAYHQVSESFASIFETMDSDYMKERAADIRDVQKRVLSHILGFNLIDPTQISEEVIVIANDLTPSDTAQLNKEFVKGFVTEIGGRTSHSAIMARSLEIPAVVGCGDVLKQVKHDDLIILNGIEGYIITSPTQEEIIKHTKLHQEYMEELETLRVYKDKPSVTKNGVHVEIAANIGNPDDLDSVLKNGADGIGLYRTEFLYMDNTDFPTEEEQFIAYKKVLEGMPNKKVIIRTLDIGGDKELEYMEMDKELNPFLGHRALRLCLDKTDLFEVQLKALLRASVYGDLHIMFPMVATINELREAKKIVDKCKNELVENNIPVSDDYKLGIMIEIPSVALLADRFAKEVDFFSIGTNDLMQYTFAADRMNEKVSYLYQPYNPSLLRLINMVITHAHNEKVWVGMCGEMAGDLQAIPILLGLGLDEFSMSASNVLKARKLLSQIDSSTLDELVFKALNNDTNEENITLINEFINNI